MTMEKCAPFSPIPLPGVQDSAHGRGAGADFNPRADPCVLLRYNPLRKEYALLTVPNLHLTHSVEVAVVAMCFPLRVTDHLTNQLATFLRPTVEDKC